MTAEQEAEEQESVFPPGYWLDRLIEEESFMNFWDRYHSPEVNRLIGCFADQMTRRPIPRPKVPYNHSRSRIPYGDVEDKKTMNEDKKVKLRLIFKTTDTCPEGSAVSHNYFTREVEVMMPKSRSHAYSSIPEVIGAEYVEAGRDIE